MSPVFKDHFGGYSLLKDSLSLQMVSSTKTGSAVLVASAWFDCLIYLHPII